MGGAPEKDLMRNWILAREGSRSIHRTADLMLTPFLDVTSVRHLGGHRLAVTFTNSEEAEVDLADELIGEVFEPLRDVEAFAEAFVDPETQTVAWPNGADLAPEFLQEIGQPMVPADAR